MRQYLLSVDFRLILRQSRDIFSVTAIRFSPLDSKVAAEIESRGIADAYLKAAEGDRRGLSAVDALTAGRFDLFDRDMRSIRNPYSTEEEPHVRYLGER
jgi:hypothetical protein